MRRWDGRACAARFTIICAALADPLLNILRDEKFLRNLHQCNECITTWQPPEHACYTVAIRAWRHLKFLNDGEFRRWRRFGVDEEVEEVNGGSSKNEWTSYVFSVIMNLQTDSWTIVVGRKLIVESEVRPSNEEIFWSISEAPIGKKVLLLNHFTVIFARAACTPVVIEREISIFLFQGLLSFRMQQVWLHKSNSK